MGFGAHASHGGRRVALRSEWTARAPSRATRTRCGSTWNGIPPGRPHEPVDPRIHRGRGIRARPVGSARPGPPGRSAVDVPGGEGGHAQGATDSMQFHVERDPPQETYWVWGPCHVEPGGQSRTLRDHRVRRGLGVARCPSRPTRPTLRVMSGRPGRVQPRERASDRRGTRARRGRSWHPRPRCRTSLRFHVGTGPGPGPSGSQGPRGAGRRKRRVKAFAYPPAARSPSGGLKRLRPPGRTGHRPRLEEVPRGTGGTRAHRPRRHRGSRGERSGGAVSGARSEGLEARSPSGFLQPFRADLDDVSRGTQPGSRELSAAVPPSRGAHGVAPGPVRRERPGARERGKARRPWSPGRTDRRRRSGRGRVSPTARGRGARPPPLLLRIRTRRCRPR